jgi:hypothetical protein
MRKGDKERRRIRKGYGYVKEEDIKGGYEERRRRTTERR